MRRVGVLTVILLCASGASIRADVIYDVSLGTAPLIGHPARPFALEIQLNDGSGTGDGNNTVLLSNFVFGGGNPSGTPSIFGGVTGNLSSSVAMTDSSFFNQFIQNFNPGATLSFQLMLTTNVDSGGVPDELSLALLDSSGFEIPTLGPADALLIIDINSGTPTISTFRTDTTQSPNARGLPIDIVTPVISTVPEPSTLALSTVVVASHGEGKRKLNQTH